MSTNTGEEGRVEALAKEVDEGIDYLRDLGELPLSECLERTAITLRSLSREIAALKSSHRQLLDQVTIERDTYQAQWQAAEAHIEVLAGEVERKDKALATILQGYRALRIAQGMSPDEVRQLPAVRDAALALSPVAETKALA